MTVLDFRPSVTENQLPPSNVETEMSLLSALLIDPLAIHKITEKKFPVEAFSVESHRVIYRACKELYAKHQPTVYHTVANWLEERDLLQKIGGREKLRSITTDYIYHCDLVDVWIDLLLEKYTKRQLIKAANDIIAQAFDSEDISSLLSKTEEKILGITQSPLKNKGEDYETYQFTRLIKAIREIELNTPDPGMKYIKLKKLAKANECTVKELESIYYKSLISGINEPAMSLAEFKDKYGQLTGEWGMGGLTPIGKTILLCAQGGRGKTRLAYEIAFHLGLGESWNGFPVNRRHKLLFVQTDETPNDTISVLEARGYDDRFDLKLKSKWTMDHIEDLRREIIEFGADFVLIDSLTSTNINSLYSENDVEYSRPLLKLKDVAQELGCTILLIHHSNKADQFRGSTSIPNSVSEVWYLQKDSSPQALPEDRLLTIEKSRSRALANYKLRYCPEEKRWICLGKEGDMDNTQSLKDKIVQLLEDNRGTAFQNEEIAEELNTSLDSIRRATYQLAEDGIIYRRELVPKKGKPQKYYLPCLNQHIVTLESGDKPSKISDRVSPVSDPSVGSEKKELSASVSALSDLGKVLDGSEKKELSASVSALSDPLPPNFHPNSVTQNLAEKGDSGSETAESQTKRGKLSDHVSDRVSDPNGGDRYFSNIPLQTSPQSSNQRIIRVEDHVATITLVKSYKKYFDAEAVYSKDGVELFRETYQPSDWVEVERLVRAEISRLDFSSPNTLPSLNKGDRVLVLAGNTPRLQKYVDEEMIVAEVSGTEVFIRADKPGAMPLGTYKLYQLRKIE